MQIEEGFRDVKSEHLGLGLNLHRSRCPKRIEVLLLIAALANYLLFLTGLQARERDLERRYQSNSWGFHDHPDTHSTNIRTLIPR